MEGRRALLVFTRWREGEGDRARERRQRLRRQRCESWWRRRWRIRGGGGSSCDSGNSGGGGGCGLFSSQLAHTFFQGLVLLQCFHIAELQLCLVFQNPLLLVLPGVALLVEVEGLTFPLLSLQP